MFFNDLVDDREAEAGAFLARRDIGFHDPFAILRQPDAIVGDCDHDCVFVLGHLYADATAIVGLCLLTGACFDGFGSILENVRHSLPKLVPVGLNFQRSLDLGGEAVIDLGIGNFLQEERLADQVESVFRTEDGLRKPCEAGKLVDHLS